MNKLKKALMKMIMTAFLVAVGIGVMDSSCQASGEINLQLGQRYTGVVSSEKINTYKMTLSESGYLNITLDSKDYGCDVYLYNSNGTEVKSWTYGRGLDYANVNLKAGTYYLKLSRWTDNTTSYVLMTSFKSAKETFTYANDYISDVSRRSAVPFRTVIRGQLATDEDNDFYRISVPKKGTITIDATTETNNTIYYTLCRENGSEVDWRFYGKHCSKSFSLAKGNYYLMVSQGYPGNYNFKVTYTKESTSTVKVKKVSAKSFKITADKVGAISGYEIQYRKKGSSSWKKVTVKGSKKLNKTIKKLKKGATYSVKMRTYYTYQGKKLYSGWSRTKSVKLK